MKNKMEPIKIGIFYGLCAVVFSIVFSMILAYLIFQQIIMPESVPYLSAAIMFVSVFICCIIGMKKKSNFIVISLGTVVTYLAILLAGKLSIFQNGGIRFGRNAIVCFGAVIFAIIITAFQKGNSKKRLRRR